MSDVKGVAEAAERLLRWSSDRWSIPRHPLHTADVVEVARAVLAPPTDENAERARFEAWVSAPPFEYNLRRFGPADAWPGNYVSLGVQLGWEAWKERGGAVPPAEDALSLTDDWLRDTCLRVEDQSWRDSAFGGPEPSAYIVAERFGVKKAKEECDGFAFFMVSEDGFDGSEDFLAYVPTRGHLRRLLACLGGMAGNPEEA